MAETHIRCLVGLILAVAAFLSGCELVSVDGDEERLRLTTDRQQYIADTSTVVRLHARNVSDAPVYYVCTSQYPSVP